MLYAARLYGYWRSSATWRVRIGLHLKEVPFTYVPVHLVDGGGEQRRPDHLARNPLAQVPVFECEDERGAAVRLTQSLPILEYLDEVAATGSPLLPASPLGRARSRQLAEMVNSGIQPLQNLRLGQDLGAMGADARVIGRDAIARGLAAIEQELALAASMPSEARPGAWLVGDRPSLADLCLIPQLYNARRFDLDPATWPRLAAVEAIASAHPAFLLAHPDAQSDAVPPPPA